MPAKEKPKGSTPSHEQRAKRGQRIVFIVISIMVILSWILTLIVK